MSDPKYKPAMDTASFVTNQEVTAAELNRLTGGTSQVLPGPLGQYVFQESSNLTRVMDHGAPRD